MANEPMNGNKPASSKDTLIGIIALVVAAIFFFATCGGSGSSSSSKKSSSKSSSSGGFVGSDGKYHAYVPEFGDDVNNWMAENW